MMMIEKLNSILPGTGRGDRPQDGGGGVDAMISSLLIANRGEIARRIIRTAKAMGIRALAVHSDVDAAMPFVREADAAFCIGPDQARERYLLPERLLAAAKWSGAAAIQTWRSVVAGESVAGMG